MQSMAGLTPPADSSSMNPVPQAPGSKWPLILGAAGFAAGFLGPMIFVPEANQGPMVGIFISGPAGALLGLMLWGGCAMLKLPAGTQWRLMFGTASIGVLATLLMVQPEPALRGYVYEGEVQSCSSPLEAQDSVIRHWDERIAHVTWAQPRAGWQADVRQVLRDAPGVVVAVRMVRKNPIKENRKPWNRGSQFAWGWQTAPAEDTLFYDAGGGCERYPTGSELRGFQAYDYDDRIPAPTAWPPTTLIDVLGASVIAPVPPQWANI
jgi:hypothetical protein